MIAGAALLVGLALYLAISGPLTSPVALRTSDHLGGECFLANTTGRLIADEEAGTAIVSEDMSRTTVPVTWPVGFTGRRTLFGQVNVLDTRGQVVAQTGNRYELLGGYTSDNTWLACIDGVYPPSW